MKKILLVLFLGILSYSVQSQVLTYVQNGDTLVMGIEQIHHIASLTGRKSGIYRSTKNTRRVDTDQYYSEIEDQIGNYLLQFTNFNGDTIALNKIYIGSIVESSSGKAIIFSSILNTQFNTMETFDTIYARAQTVPWTASGATGPGGLFEASNDTETMAVDTAYVKPSVGLTIIHNQSGSIRNYTSFKNLKFETASAFGSANSLFKVEGGSLFGYGGSTSDGFTGTFGRLFVNNFGYDARFFNTSAGDEGQMILDFNGSKFRFDDGTTDRFINITTSGISINGNYTWPDADGSANQVLSTNGSGTLGFTDALNGVYSAGNDASEAAIDSLMINSAEDFGIYAQGTYPNYFKMAGATGIDYGVTGLFGIAHRFRMTSSIGRWESTNTGSNQQSIIEITPTTISFVGESTSTSLDSRMVITGNGADIRMQHTDASNTNTYQVEVDDTGVNINENYYFANDDGNAGELVSTDGAGQYGYTAPETFVYRESDSLQFIASDISIGGKNSYSASTGFSLSNIIWTDAGAYDARYSGYYAFEVPGTPGSNIADLWSSPPSVSILNCYVQGDTRVGKFTLSADILYDITAGEHNILYIYDEGACGTGDGPIQVITDIPWTANFTHLPSKTFTVTAQIQDPNNLTVSNNALIENMLRVLDTTFLQSIIYASGLSTDNAPTKVLTLEAGTDEVHETPLDSLLKTALDTFYVSNDTLYGRYHSGATIFAVLPSSSPGGGTPIESPVYLNRDSVTWIQDEFSSGTLLSTAQNGTMGNIGWDQTVSGTVTTSSPYVSGHPGVLQLLQTTSNAYEFIDLPQTKIRLDKDFQLVVVARVNDVTISTHGTQWGYFQLGLVEDAAWNINPSNGLFFRVNGTSGTTFLAQTSNGGTRTEASTGINCQANAWHEFRIEWDASSSTAKFYIDGALTNTSTTNLPTGTTLTPRLGSSNGTVSSITTTSQWDYFYLRTQL